MIPVDLPICSNCKHFYGRSCEAFPKGIPQAIIEGTVDHHKPYKGDSGIVFEEKKRDLPKININKDRLTPELKARRKAELAQAEKGFEEAPL